MKIWWRKKLSKDVDVFRDSCRFLGTPTEGITPKGQTRNDPELEESERDGGLAGRVRAKEKVPRKGRLSGAERSLSKGMTSETPRCEGLSEPRGERDFEHKDNLSERERLEEEMGKGRS